jgi:GNAT superfamily N-acetyltransferase
LFFIAVDPSIRGRGMGTLLMEASIAKARSLWVRNAQINLPKLMHLEALPQQPNACA